MPVPLPTLDTLFVQEPLLESHELSVGGTHAIRSFQELLDRV